MKRILFLFTIVSTLFSCGDNWIEGVKPHDGSITPNIIFSSEQSIENAIVGTIDYMKEYYANRHVTVGVRFYYLGLDWMGNDMVTNPGQWWTYESGWNSTILAPTGYITSYYWGLFYSVINDANTKIKGIEESSVSQEYKTKAIAELRAIRGYCYFNLARVYQKSYRVAGSEASCVPIYTEPTTSTTTGKAAATLGEVYNQIMEDYDKAIESLSTTRKAKFRINKDVVLAWRANANLEMGKWPQAEKDAHDSYTGRGYDLMDAATYSSIGFNTISTAEWMWGFPFQPDQAWGYASLFSHLDVFRPQNGYKNFFINTDFVALFSETDMRNLFVTPSPAYTAARPWALNTSRKFQDRQSVDGDWVMMRSSEMILVEAEALARQNKDVEARRLLYSLQKHRDPDAIESVNTGDDLLNEILVERRKELYAEIGTEYFDAKRYNRSIKRTGNHTQSYLFEKTPDMKAWGWIIPIPQSELDNNSNILQTTL